jgi:hypothetical protein
MGLNAILLFFWCSYGLGFTVTRLVEGERSVVERFFMRIGIGIGTWAILGIILHTLHIPLDWRIFLALSSAYPVLWLVRNYRHLTLRLRLKKHDMHALVAVLLALVLLVVFLKGAFSYPWLEDDDSWNHALGVKYVEVEKTLRERDSGRPLLQYIDPYPPAYDMILGILKQVDESVNWTLKFFNSLFVALSLVFFYFFAKEFMGDSKKALFSTFVLFAIPSYLSHFIWTHTLVVMLLPVSLYCLERSKHSKRWWVIGGIVVAGIFVTQPTQPIKFGIMWGTYWVVGCLTTKSWNLKVIGTIALGALLSLSWWLTRFKAMFFGHSTGTFIAAEQVGTSFGLLEFLQKTFPPESGSATRAYGFGEIIGAKAQNMINNPVGIGVVLTIIIVLGLVYAFFKYRSWGKEQWIPIAVLWTLFAFLGFNALTFHLPFGLYGFRFWMLFAFSAALIAPLGLTLLYKLGRSAGIPRFLVLAAVVAGIFFTSFIPKYGVNTSIWMSPGFDPTDGMQGKGYVWIKSLPAGTQVFDLSTFYTRVHGMDMFSCDWCPGVSVLREDFLALTPDAFYQRLTALGYQYVIVSAHSFSQFDEASMRRSVESMINSTHFSPVHNTESVIIFRIV